MSVFDQFQPDREDQFLSTGYFCGMFQILPGQLAVLMEDSCIKFSQVIDGVGYLNVPDALIIGRRCNEVRGEISEAIQKLQQGAPQN